MTLNLGSTVQQDSSIYLVLRGYLRSGRTVEHSDVPYVKLVREKNETILEYIYVPERMRGYKLSFDLLELMFEYMEANKLTDLKFECLCKLYWRKVSARFPNRIYFPPLGSERTNIVYVRLPQAAHEVSGNL